MHSEPLNHSLLYWSVCLLCCGLSLAGFGKTSQVQLTLREQLNQTYVNELVYFPFTAKRGACPADSVRVTGPHGSLPAQLTDVTYWPGKAKSVKSARLAVLVDQLAPLSVATYTVSYGTDQGFVPTSDLQVMRAQNQVELTTSHLSLRLPLGSTTFATPAAAETVPGPLSAMRLGDGTWAGDSALSGAVPVKAWSAVLTDAGPAFARVKMTYTFADGNVLTLAALLAAGDTAARWEMHAAQDRPAQGLDFRLPPLPGVTQAVFPHGYGQWARDRVLPIVPSAKPFCLLSPDSSIINQNPDNPPIIRLIGDGNHELQLRSHDPGAWVEPVKPFTYGGYPQWNLEMMPGCWEHWHRKRMPVSYAADGTVTLHAGLEQGWRKWSVSAGAPLVGDQLDRRNTLVLDWPLKDTAHPHLFVSRQQVEERWQRAQADPALKAQLLAGGAAASVLPAVMTPAAQRTPAQRDAAVAQLRDYLAKLGNYDVMRHGVANAGLYDALIDSDLLTAQERTLFRAQMAYLGYVMADAGCWSQERGFHTGNPNMHISYTLTLGIIACLLPDHPLAKTWANYATTWMEKWLADEVGAQGEWMSEGISYGGQVSFPPLLAYALAAKRAGYHDFTNDPRLVKLMEYFARQYTPPDPRHNNLRLSPPVGRGHGWQTSGYLGLAAKLTADGNPDASRMLQWLWARGDYALQIGDTRLGGFEGYYLDKQLPKQAPEWGSILFPGVGAVLRHGFNTPSEHYLNLLSHVDSLRNLDIWTPCVGSIATWFAYGKPVSVNFNFDGGYYIRHELLRDGVLLAHYYDGAGNGKAPFGYYTTTHPEAFASLPSADYVRATYVNTRVDDRDWFPEKMPATPKIAPATSPNLQWTRQTLFVKDADPAGPTWLLLRDTTAGGQPTQWQFWALSEKIGTPQQVRDPAFRAELPGKTILPARDLPPGNLYTAIGQFGVDLDFYVAEPANSPRATMRYGGKALHIEEYQDMLQLRLPGDGAYYTAIVPRAAGAPSPVFSTVGDGKIIKVAGTDWTDYALLATTPVTATDGELHCSGTACTAAVRTTGTALSLGAAGEIHFGKYGLQAPTAASLQMTPQRLTLILPVDNTGGKFILYGPAGWRLKHVDGIKASYDGRQYTITVRPGVQRVEFVQ